MYTNLPSILGFSKHLLNAQDIESIRHSNVPHGTIRLYYSSRYGKSLIIFLRKSSNTSCIRDWNVAGAFFSLKGITLNSLYPLWVRNVFLWMSYSKLKLMKSYLQIHYGQLFCLFNFVMQFIDYKYLILVQKCSFVEWSMLKIEMLID